MDAGADITITEPIAGKYGTALQAASAVGSLEIVEELLREGAVVNVSPANGKYGSCLSAAAAGGHKAIVALLIKHKADVNAKGGLHGFPILAAAQSGDSNVVQLLLDNGANASAKGGLYGSAIAAAAYANNLNIIKRLIEHGADPHARGGKYGNAIQAAAMKADVDIIDDLLNRAIDLVNHRDGKYHTALIAASYFNRMEIVIRLLDGGADFRFQGNARFRSAISAASMRGNKAILDKFLAMGPPDHLLDDALVEACAHRQSTCVEVLLKAGANVYARHPTLGTPADALIAPERDDDNSDIEDEHDTEDGEEKVDDDGNEDDEWEGDNVSVGGQTDDGSVTDLQLEEEISEEAKIQKLLDEAMARCKRNPTVKRFRTVKHRRLPSSLSSGLPLSASVPKLPPGGTYQTYSQANRDEQFGSPYGQHSQEPWSLPFRSESATEHPADHYGQSQPTVESEVYNTYPAPLFAKQHANSPPLSPQRVQSPQDMQRVPHPVPPLQPERQFSSGSASSIPQSHTPPPRQGSQDHGLRRQSKASNRRSLINPGQSSRYQERQTSYPKPTGLDRSISEHDYATLDRNVAPPLAPHTSRRASQQYSPSLTQRESQRFSQVQHSAQQAPPSASYPDYSSPPMQEAGHIPHDQASQTSSPASSMYSSQYANSTPYVCQSYAPWDTPTSSQASGFNDAQSLNDAQGRKWAGGGYDGEGYG